MCNFNRLSGQQAVQVERLATLAEVEPNADGMGQELARDLIGQMPGVARPGFRQAETLLELADAARRAFQALLEKIRQGSAPRDAIAQVMKDFNADALEGFREAFSAVLESSLGEKALKAWPVGGVKLSDRLYANAQQVSATTRTIIEQHMKGLHSARELAKTLYEGYGFKEDELKVIARLPKYLRKEFSEALAAQLKTPALRAAYLQAIRKAQSGAGMAELAKRLKVAFYERNRYFANRIARTELHRNYTDQQARELMEQDRIQYVQIRLSSKHPKPDICDLHARLDAYGLGAGIYPKADAPRPPFHPHCYCLLSPMIALINPKPKFNPKAERDFLKSLPAKEARAVAGSFAKLERAKAGETLEAIYNEGKDELYRWKRVGDILTTTGNPSEAAVSNAYEVAKAGGRHSPWYKQQLELGYRQLQKGIQSIEKQIADHESWIADPQKKVKDWTVRDPRYQAGLLKKWQQDIARQKEQVEILKGVLKEKK